MADHLSLVVAVALVAGLLSIFFVRRRQAAGQNKLRLPPSPPALPVIGHLHLLGAIPHQALHRISERFGPLVCLWLGPVRCVLVSDAETAEEFLKGHEIFFTGRPDSVVVTTLYNGTGGFVFAPYGDRLRFIRKLCAADLLGSRTLERLRWIRREETQRFFRTMREKAEKGRDVDLGEELTGLTSNIICQMSMSKRCSGTVDGEASVVQELVKEMSELAGRFNIADMVGFCKKLDPQGLQKRAAEVRRRFDVMMENILREKEASEAAVGDRSGGASRDVVDILLDIDGDAQVKLTRDDIKFFIRDIFGAGTETSAVTIEWALAELINHPAILRKAREEIDAVVGGESRMVSESDIPNLPYLQAIVKETLRLHPPVPMILRESNERCKVMGFDIPEKTRVFVNVWAMGRDPKQWDAPLEFRPERFTEGGTSAGVEPRGHHYQLLPFGSGRRVCPGMSLALQVTQPTLAAMIQCFDWRVKGGGAVDMAEAPGLSLLRARPLTCTPAARLNLPPPPTS